MTDDRTATVVWLKRWAPALGWAVAISIFSTHVFTADNTGRFIIPILHWMFPAVSAVTLEHMHFFIRKCGHFAEYFLLSLLILHGFRAGHSTMRLKWALIVVLIVGAYASLDEFHQRFVPGRTAAVSDVVLDTIAGTVAQLTAGLVFLTRKREQNEA